MCSFFMLVGRICISLIFLLGGFSKFANYEGTAAYMESQGMTMIPFFLYGAAIVEILGGLSLIFGILTRYGAILLMLFLIPVTYIFHDFWSMEGQQMQQEMIHFFCNVAIFGGLLYVACCGSGCCSVDHCRSCK